MVESVSDRLARAFYLQISMDKNSFLVREKDKPWEALKPNQKNFYKEISNTFIEGIISENMVIMTMPDDIEGIEDNEQSNKFSEL